MGGKGIYIPNGSIVKDARVLIVDDQEANVILLERLLEKAGYNSIQSTTDARRSVEMYESFDPDVILLDLNMPFMSGYDVLQRLQPLALERGSFLAVLVLTADISERAKEKALAMGAKDFLTKPISNVEALLRINNLAETRRMHVELQTYNRDLEGKVRERTEDIWTMLGRLEDAEKELRASREETVHRLSIAAEFRDDETAKHIERMSEYCAILARAAGYDDQQIELMRVASQMHDIGKIATPDRILLKPGRLTQEERGIIEQHPEVGFRILEGSSSDLLQLAATIAYTHHERIDGTGYPRGLADGDIPNEGRIAAIADVFDALTTDRVYRKAFPLMKALGIMREGRGTQFDADLLDLFFDSLDIVLEARDLHEDEGKIERRSDNRVATRIKAAG